MSKPLDSRPAHGEARARWTEIYDMSQQLGELVRKGDWQAAAGLHSRRDLLIKRSFSIPLPSSEASEVRKAILATLELNKEFIATTRREKTNVAGKIGKLQSGREARKAYIEIGTGT